MKERNKKKNCDRNMWFVYRYGFKKCTMRVRAENMLWQHGRVLLENCSGSVVR